MKVNSLSNNIKTPSSNPHPNNQVRNQDINSPSVTASSSAVEISKALLNIKADLATDAAFNTEKVNQIKAAIEEGRFEVNSNAVASNLIATAHDLLNIQTIKR
ncbi:MAG: Anti-sigma-28 factor, FlgM [Pseudomonadota bacterium]|jgi:negative regulator of flagellin synthesis FlgM